MPPVRREITFSNRTIIRVIALVILAGLFLKFIGNIVHPLTLIFISFFLALALNPTVSWISKHLKLRSRAAATAIAYLMVVVVLASFFALVIPPLVNQTRSFIADAPTIVNNFKNQDSGVAGLARHYKLDVQLEKAAHDLAGRVNNVPSTVISTGKRIGSTFISVLTVFVMTFMMLVEGPEWIERYWSVVPAKRREHHKKLARRMYRAVTAFVNGQVILAAIAGSFALMALLVASTALNVSINPVALAGIVALFGIIPMIGNPISSTIVVIICLLSSANLAIIMLVYFLVYYQIENITLQPYIQSRKNELSPLIVFIAAIIGIVGFHGILGAFIAIPAASCIKILVDDYFKDKISPDAPDPTDKDVKLA